MCLWRYWKWKSALILCVFTVLLRHVTRKLEWSVAATFCVSKEMGHTNEGWWREWKNYDERFPGWRPPKMEDFVYQRDVVCDPDPRFSLQRQSKWVTAVLRRRMKVAAFAHHFHWKRFLCIQFNNHVLFSLLLCGDVCQVSLRCLLSSW